jgi:hypothetical protein
LEDFEKKFPATQGERKKKSCSIQSRKKNIMQKRALKKKISTCNSTDALHFSIVSTGLQDFAFLSRIELAHLLKRTRGEQWIASQGFYRLWSL